MGSGVFVWGKIKSTFGKSHKFYFSNFLITPHNHFYGFRVKAFGEWKFWIVRSSSKILKEK